MPTPLKSAERPETGQAATRRKCGRNIPHGCSRHERHIAAHWRLFRGDPGAGRPCRNDGKKKVDILSQVDKLAVIENAARTGGMIFP